LLVRLAKCPFAKQNQNLLQNCKKAKSENHIPLAETVSISGTAQLGSLVPFFVL